MLYQHRHGFLENKILLSKARHVPAVGIDRWVNISLLHDPEGQHRPSMLPPVLAPVKLLQHIPSSAASPGALRLREELQTSFHSLCWPIATCCASFYVPCQVLQLLPALRCQHQAFAPGRYVQNGLKMYQQQRQIIAEQSGTSFPIFVKRTLDTEASYSFRHKQNKD